MFKTLNNWLFDGSLKSHIPKPKINNDGDVVVPDILKYNSPITHTYIIKIFLRNGPLNHFLDNYLNNINLRYLDKYELLKFIKKCVIDFRFRKQDLTYYQYNQKDKLFEKLRIKIPILKNEDISFLSELIMKSKDKESIYTSLGLEKIKKKVKNKKKSEKISLKYLIEKNFSIVTLK